MLRLGLAVGLLLAAAAASPHAEYIEQLMKSSELGGRYSNDIYEDARLDVPELVRKYNYPLEEHFVTTEDGYILGMHRIPHGRDANNRPDPNKSIVFVMHGLFSSSADFVLMGPGTALGYILAEQGYDVWMGNARGNYYSRRHTRFNPDAILNTRFWEFSWDEIGNIDLPAMIDYALEYTGKKRLHYIGHSQGTTVFFVMGSLRPDYNEKIISMHAMGPVAYMAHNRHIIFNALAPYSTDLSRLANLVGIGEFLPNNNLMTWAGQTLCRDEVVFQAVCSNVMFVMGGWNREQHNTTMLPVKLGHTPAGASVRQLAHYGQGIDGKRFRRFDYGTIRNLRVYGRRNPPAYDLSKVTAPVFLHYSENDPFAHINDVTRLFRELGAPIGKFRVTNRRFSHIDFMWGIDAKTLVYNRIMNLIQAMDIHG
ncbi:lipase 1-like [Epargyreus clarus]|uniref:lipase 1-like n=1 Tax=Epargyreus clarus TaxID=520877 RepID=UPI003C2B0641